MFSEGQKVWHRNGQRSGTVLECDGDRVFIVQDNGAELDFAASDLTATPPGDVKGAGATLRESREAARSANYVAPNRALTASAIASVFERRPNAGKFSALGIAEKLNAIAEITAVPYRTMRAYSDRPSELSLLMGKGLADAAG
jgi:hypothetical protein